MQKKRRLKRKLEILNGGKPHNPRKEDASRYSDNLKRGAKHRGPATECPKCGSAFFSRKQRSKHMQVAHRERGE